jgi:hypothetical protein
LTQYGYRDMAVEVQSGPCGELMGGCYAGFVRDPIGGSSSLMPKERDTLIPIERSNVIPTYQ